MSGVFFSPETANGIVAGCAYIYQQGREKRLVSAVTSRRVGDMWARVKSVLEEGESLPVPTTSLRQIMEADYKELGAAK